MAKKPTLLEAAKAKPDVSEGTLATKLITSGMQEEFDEIIAAYVAGKLAAKFSSKRKLYAFLAERLPFKFGVTAFKSYIEMKYGKNSH